MSEKLELRSKTPNFLKKFESYTSAEKRKIKAYLQKTLPENEPRIETPMHPECKVVMVIPAYSEKNYILRLPLLSLARQVGVSNNEFEVIVVVNNPPGVPPREYNEPNKTYKRRVQYYKDSLENNQKTLELFHYLQRLQNGDSSRVTPNLSEQELDMCREVAESGLNIHVIDKASKGHTLPMKRANVGGARDHGHVEAIKRFKVINRNGIIAQTDAEVAFEPEHIARLIRIFKSDPALIGVTGAPPKAEYGEDEEQKRFERLGVYSDMLMFYDDIQNWVRKKKTGKTTKTRESLMEGIASRFDGKNMAGLAFESALAGGIPHKSGGEDPGFGSNLAKVGKIAIYNKLVIHPEPRKSTSVHYTHGVGWRIVHLSEQIERHGTILVRDPSVFSQADTIRASFRNVLKKRSATVEQLKNLFTISGKCVFLDRELEQLAKCIVEFDRDYDRFKSNPVVVSLSQKWDHVLNSKKQFLIGVEKATPILIQALCSNEIIRKKYERRLNKLRKKEIQANATLLTTKQKETYFQLQAMYEVTANEGRPWLEDNKE